MDMFDRPTCWLFQATPDRYRIDKRLADKPRIMTWLVPQHFSDVKEGETAFIYRCKGTHNKHDSGIVAEMRISCDPVEMTDLPFEEKYYIDNEFFACKQRRVICEIMKVEWLEDGDIHDLELPNQIMHNKTVFSLTPKQATSLNKRMESASSKS